MSLFSSLSLRWCLVVSAAMWGMISCGGGGSSLSVLWVGGTYATDVSLLLGNTCSGVTVESNPTTVTHVPGSMTLSVTHAGINYSGSVDNTGRFTTCPTQVGSGGNQFVITISGQFSRTGFDATVTVQQVLPTACSYMVHWIGTKSGAPNTFP